MSSKYRMNEEQQDYSEFVEVDPTGRYGRYDEILGKGASKIVYRAFDEYEGIEVAWNQVKLHDFLRSKEDVERLYCEIHLLKTLKHKNIMKFYASWVDMSKRNINFVTELFTSGTLKQYRQKHRRVNIKAVKNWCRQILMALHYLHGLNPPVIHRDLKCDNIFINGNQGEVKIGDLGLAAILRKSHAEHCVGTPEFMAPEVYEEEYNELVDIYSFGMCLLEMVTFEYPYSECTHPAQIYKKVVSGTYPEALYRVKDPEMRHFVEKCLADASRRLSAKELLKDPFLQIDDDADGSEQGLIFRQPSLALFGTNGHTNGFPNDLRQLNEIENGQDYYDDISIHGINLFDSHEDEPVANVDITIKGRRNKDGRIFLRLRISDKDGCTRNIYFPFDVVTDTALSVATEMVAELDITDYEVTRIAGMIDNEVSSLVPEWVPGPCTSETPRFHPRGSCGNRTSNVSSRGSFFDYLSKTPVRSDNQSVHCSNQECALMHGRFEEITYQEGAPGRSTSQSDEDFDGEDCKKRTSILDRNLHDDCENEIDQELRWVKAKYEKEPRDHKNCRLGEPRRVMHPTTDMQSRGSETHECSSSYETCGDQSFPDLESERGRDCEANEEGSSPEPFTAKKFYAFGAPVPNCPTRTRSHRVDIVSSLWQQEYLPPSYNVPNTPTLCNSL